MNGPTSSDKGAAEVVVGIEECRDTVFYDHCSQPSWCDLADYTYSKRELTEGRVIREVEESLGTKDNVLVVGLAGVGKSTLIRKIIEDFKKSGQRAIRPFYVDLNGPDCPDNS